MLAERRWPALGLVSIGLAVLSSCTAETPPRSAADARPNVLVVVLDAARRDHFGFYGYERDTTPHLDRFVEQATVFEEAVSEASFTYASIASLMLGKPPGHTGLLGPKPIRGHGPTLAEQARASGYRTFAYSENGFISPAFGFQSGFERFLEGLPPNAGRSRRGDFEHPESEGHLREALDWMSREPSPPFFAYVHLLRPHNPYTPPPEMLGRFGPVLDTVSGSTDELLEIDSGKRVLTVEERAALIDRYDENLAFADQLFGQIWSGLQESGLADDTIVVFLSDHGEAFGEHGRWLHNNTVYDEMIRVPLVIRHPWRLEARRVRGVTQLADVHATLLDLMNARSSANGFGRSLLPGLLGEPADLTRLGRSWSASGAGWVGIRSSGHKVIGSTAFGQDHLEVYDLDSDPGETVSRTGEDRVLQPLLRELERQQAGIRRRGTLASPTDDIDPEVLDRLRALGYLR